MNNLSFALLMLFLVPMIALFDYLLFRKWTACERCGFKGEEWFRYLIPTMIEVLCFLSGIAIGQAI